MASVFGGHEAPGPVSPFHFPDLPAGVNPQDHTIHFQTARTEDGHFWYRIESAHAGGPRDGSVACDECTTGWQKVWASVKAFFGQGKVVEMELPETEIRERKSQYSVIRKYVKHTLFVPNSSNPVQFEQDFYENLRSIQKQDPDNLYEFQPVKSERTSLQFRVAVLSTLGNKEPLTKLFDLNFRKIVP
jgi:hypothetical protein